MGINMKNLKPVMGIVLVYLLGAVSGAFLDHMFEHSRHEAFSRGGPEAREKRYMEQLSAKLDLDEQQKEKIKGIVHENFAAVRQVRKQYQPQIQMLQDQGQSQINALLKPEQQTKFQQIIMERKAKRPAGI